MNSVLLKSRAAAHWASPQVPATSMPWCLFLQGTKADGPWRYRGSGHIQQKGAISRVPVSNHQHSAFNHIIQSLCTWSLCSGTTSFWRRTLFPTVIATHLRGLPTIIRQQHSKHSILFWDRKWLREREKGVRKINSFVLKRVLGSCLPKGCTIYQGFPDHLI